MIRGRVRIRWCFAAQTRANTARTWLDGQLSGRTFITEHLPPVANDPRYGWVVTADVSFDTTTEGNTIKTLADARQSSDTFVQGLSAGKESYTLYHNCAHTDGTGVCTSGVVRTVKA